MALPDLRNCLQYTVHLPEKQILQDGMDISSIETCELLERKQRIKLVVIGGDDHNQVEMQRLKTLSRILKIGESVIFLGSVKQETLPFFYSAADLCVVPSYYESFGLVVLESLACRTPVVATKVGCAESVIRYGETGHVVTDNDPGGLAN